MSTITVRDENGDVMKVYDKEDIKLFKTGILVAALAVGVHAYIVKRQAALKGYRSGILMTKKMLETPKMTTKDIDEFITAWKTTGELGSRRQWVKDEKAINDIIRKFDD